MMNFSQLSSSSTDSYDGFVPKDGFVIERISSDMDAHTFFDRFVSQRKPVIITGHLTDPEWRGSKLWTNDYMRDRAGSSVVEVEKRAENSEFGLSSPKVHMKFGEFLTHLEDGSDKFYITTQTIEELPSNAPVTIAGPPVAQLKGDFPKNPKLLGNLATHNTNLWMGNTKEGTSTGLHHDFHDNLYILLRGRKRFRLYAPSSARHLDVYGTVSKIYPNGLICYTSQSITADGAPLETLSHTIQICGWEIRKKEHPPGSITIFTIIYIYCYA
eukprot:365240_1